MRRRRSRAGRPAEPGDGLVDDDRIQVAARGRPQGDGLPEVERDQLGHLLLAPGGLPLEP